MKCFKIKQVLWDYVDNELNKKDIYDIEKHLKTCRNCKKELALIKSYKKKVSVKNIKTPVNFLQKVNERIEEENKSILDKIIKKLFIPFKIKIPLELAGALITTIIVVIIFIPSQKNIQMVDKVETIKTKESEIKFYSKASKKSIVREKDKKKFGRGYLKDDNVGMPISDLSENIIEDQMEFILIIDEDTLIDLDETVSPDVMRKKSASKTASFKEMEEEKNKDSIRSINTFAGKVSKHEESVSEQVIVEKKSNGKKKKINIYQLNTAFIKITNITRQNKGRIIQKNYNKANTYYESVIVEVPVKNYKIFIQELNNLGQVQQQKKIKKMRNRKWIQNRIEIQQAK